jgi:hypothetical protein
VGQKGIKEKVIWAGFVGMFVKIQLNEIGTGTTPRSNTLTDYLIGRVIKLLRGRKNETHSSL